MLDKISMAVDTNLTSLDQENKMTSQKKQIVPINANLRSCSIEIIPAVLEKQIPETARFIISGIVLYGETDSQVDFRIEITEDLAYSTLPEDAKVSIANLIENSRKILQKKYVLKASP